VSQTSASTRIEKRGSRCVLRFGKKFGEAIVVRLSRRKHTGHANPVVLQRLQEFTGEAGSQFEEIGGQVRSLEEQSHRPRLNARRHEVDGSTDARDRIVAFDEAHSTNIACAGLHPGPGPWSTDLHDTPFGIPRVVPERIERAMIAMGTRWPRPVGAT
jgi:hypothetical protein